MAEYGCPLASRAARLGAATLLVVAFLSWAIGTASAGAQSRALGIEETVRAREFAAGSKIQFSPDGKWLAYTVIRSHALKDPAIRNRIPWFGRNADIHVSETATGNEQIVTGQEFDNWWPVWSPDSRFLTFLSDRDGGGKPKVWVWSARDRTLRKISNAIAALGPIEWTPDGRQIIFSRVMEPHEAANHASAKVEPLQTSGSTVTVYDPSIQPTSDPWGLANYSMSLELCDIENGKTTTLVEGQIGVYKLSPDGSRLAFTQAKRFEKAGSQQILFDLRVLDMKSGASQTAVPEVRLDFDGSGFSWSPDNQQLCVRSFTEDSKASLYSIVNLAEKSTSTFNGSLHLSGLGSREVPLWDESGKKIYFLGDGKLWSANLESAQVREVAQVLTRQITQIISRWDDIVRPFDRSSILVVTNDDAGKQDGIYAINLSTGQSRKILEQGECYSCVLDAPSVATTDGQRIAFVSEDALHAPDLWVGDAGLRSFHQITHLNPHFDPRLMGKACLIEWLSDDGERLKGVLLLPSDYEPQKRYPLVTWVYGGALLSNRFDTFGLTNSGPLNMQLLATRGFAVFLPDAPQRPGMAMLSLAKTVLPGVNKAIELGYADPDRLAIMGHSNGGYSVLSLVVQTIRFKAAIVMAGLGDLVSAYGEMQTDGTSYGVSVAEQGQLEMGGTPWNRRDAFIENSPFFYFDRIQTPVLIIHGSDDPAVAAFLADQTFVALRRLGKEVEYAKYAGEGHSPSQEWSYSNQVDLCSRMIRWLDLHLMQNER